MQVSGNNTNNILKYNENLVPNPRIDDRPNMSFDNEDSNPSGSGGKGVLKAAAVASCVGLVCIAMFAAARYKVARPSEYIVRTGLGIKDIKISKTAVQWPLQKAFVLDIKPDTFDVNIHAMSKQRIPFNMPSRWTVAAGTDQQSLSNFSRLMMDKGSDGIKHTVEGVIQGEARVLTAQLDHDEIFSNREGFKENVVVKVSEVLKPLGLHIYNANIADLIDQDDKNKFFSEQKQRALQNVTQEARIHIAEALRKGEIGEKTQQAETRQSIAKIEKETLIIENANRQKIQESNKDLAISEAQYKKQLDVAKSEFKKEVDVAAAVAKTQAEKTSLELQKEVETIRREQEIERIRAADLSSANVAAEVSIRKAEGEAQAKRIVADAELYLKQKQAQGVLALKEAEAAGWESILKAIGHNFEGINQYRILENNILQDLAAQQAKALQGLQPKISVWSTGNKDLNPLSSILTDFLKTGMPLFDSVKHQTGYDFLGSAGIRKEIQSKDDDQEKKV